MACAIHAGPFFSNRLLRVISAMMGEMAISITLSDADGGTTILVEHQGLLPGLAPADNETGWRMALAILEALAENAVLAARYYAHP